jgi:hypothetical protein
MLKVKKTSPKRVEIDLKGELDAASMAIGLDELIAVSADVENGQILYRIPTFAMPSLSALAVEFTRLPSLISLLSKYDRCAVLTDVEWLRSAAEFEGVLIPGFEVKAFALDDEAAALVWLDAG